MATLVVLFVRLVVAVVQLVQPRRLVVTSFCRTPDENEAAGGVPNSFHLECLAIDMVLDEISAARVVETWTALGLDAVLYEGGRVHLELEGPALR